jgi:hypothetical protein
MRPCHGLPLQMASTLHLDWLELSGLFGIIL